MGKVTGSWERQIQGVSQQADKDRINGQCTLQENHVPSPLSGLIKRVGTRNVKQLMDSSSMDALWHIYERGDEEAYLINIEPNRSPRVFDLDGVERVVRNELTDQDYYRVSNPREELKISTIADYSFILNTKKVIRADDALVPENESVAILYCQYANYGRDYIVNLNGIQAAVYTTKSGEVANDIYDVKTNNIIEKLAPQITGKMATKESGVAVKDPFSSAGILLLPDDADIAAGAVGGYNKTKGLYLRQEDLELVSNPNAVRMKKDVTSGDEVEVTFYSLNAPDSEYEVEQHGNVMFIWRTDGEPFTISTVDGASGNDLVAVQDIVQQLSNLPPNAPLGHTVRVQNKQGFTANSYWLKAVASERGEATGSAVKWVEAPAPNSKYKFDISTMPINLISEADGSFVLTDGEWEERKVGDDETNPFPSFIDNTVTGVGTFQNRMMFTSSESAIFGRTGHFFSFFRETTQAEADSDPVDGFADADEINNLHHHAVLDGDIVFFAENGQFLVDGSKPLTKANLTFKRVTSYPVNIKCKPAITGESVMFSFTSGKYAGIREMFTDSITDTKKARPITEHVSEYIVGLPIIMAASPNINTLLTLTDKTPNVLYVYDWLWIGDQKAQSAMHKWTFGGDIKYCRFVRDKLFIVIKRSDGVYLEMLPISSDTEDDGLDFGVHLDRRQLVEATWSSENQRWEWVMPYDDSDKDGLEFVRGTGCYEEDKGTSVIYEFDGQNYWSYDEFADWKLTRSVKLTAGIGYYTRYVPTQPYIKDTNDRVIGLDRFTLGAVSINYEATGDIEVIVLDKYSQGRYWKYEHNGRRIGTWNNIVGFAPLTAGKFKFPIRLPSDQARIEVRSRDYRPFIIRSMEWEGMFKQRGQRL